jgi:hypothetical protein
MTEDKFIYTVTVFNDSDPDQPYYTRTPGVFTSLERAVQAVKHNDMDLAERGYNLYAVVERVTLDMLYPETEQTIRDRWWFKWNAELETYVEMPVPAMYARAFGFGIG